MEPKQSRRKEVCTTTEYMLIKQQQKAPPRKGTPRKGLPRKPPPKEKKPEYNKNYRDKQTKARKKSRNKHPTRLNGPLDEKDAKKYGTYDPIKTDRLVEYKTSTIENAGNGVFAGEKLYKDDIVTEYYGKIYNEKPTDPNEIEYCVLIGKEKWLVAKRTPTMNKGIGAYINREARMDKKIV